MEALKNLKYIKDKAEKDRDNLLNIVKKLEFASNNYEINAELGVKTIAAIASLISVSGGFLLSWILSRISSKLSTPKSANLINYMSKLTIPAGFIGTIFLVGPLTKITKDAARLGRYKEKSDFLQNPTNFISFTDEEKNSIKVLQTNNNENVSTTKNIIKNFRDIYEMKEEIAEFNKYKKEQNQEELKLRESLKQIPISDKQIAEAKRLQKQAFIVFEKIDDKSESFVDDTNAALSSLSTLINGTTCTIANLLTLKFFGNKISEFTKDKKMPGFWEGLKLTKNLKFKDLVLIFIVPFLVTRLVILGVNSNSSEIKKYACQIGIMSAMQDLEDPKNFIV